MAIGAMLIAGSADAAEFHISPDGRDSNPGTADDA